MKWMEGNVVRTLNEPVVDGSTASRVPQPVRSQRRTIRKASGQNYQIFLVLPLCCLWREFAGYHFFKSQNRKFLGRHALLYLSASWANVHARGHSDTFYIQLIKLSNQMIMDYQMRISNWDFNPKAVEFQLHWFNWVEYKNFQYFLLDGGFCTFGTGETTTWFTRYFSWRDRTIY